MNYEEIISDFETLRQQIREFRTHMTIDDYYFYQLKRPGRFEQLADDLSEKHFGTHWESLEQQFSNRYGDASAHNEKKLKTNILALNMYFFATDLSYQRKYETEYDYDPDEEPDWKGRIFPKSEKQVWTGEYEVHRQEHAGRECFRSDLEITRPEPYNLLPKNWKQVVNTFIHHPWKTFEGGYSTGSGIWQFSDYITRTPKTLTTTDYTCFLAIKNALRSGLHMTTHEQEILMQVSSGIAAKIALRKTSPYVSEITGSGQQIYNMTDFDWEREPNYSHQAKTLLHISGYTKSEINVHIPKGYYFVGHEYILELEFVAAPILLNNAVIPTMSAADPASMDLLDDEEEEQKRWEDLQDED